MTTLLATVTSLNAVVMVAGNGPPEGALTAGAASRFSTAVVVVQALSCRVT
ncbi:hypothetical protein [Actinopolymorpha pittospori]